MSGSSKQSTPKKGTPGDQVRSGMHAASHLPGRPTDVDDGPATEVNQNPDDDDDDRQTEGQTENQLTKYSTMNQKKVPQLFFQLFNNLIFHKWLYKLYCFSNCQLNRFFFF